MGYSFGDVCAQCVELVSDVPVSFLLLFLFSTLIGAFALIYSVLFVVAPIPRKPSQHEKTYRTLSEDGSVTDSRRLPCWQDTLDSHRQKNGKPDVFEIEEPDLFMSVVVPAYNEEHRLAGMLEETANYLEHAYGTLADDYAEKMSKENGRITANKARQRKANGKSNGRIQDGPAPLKGWEIIIVSDGSTDKTVDTSFSFTRDHQLSLHPKGRAGPWTPHSRPGVHIPPGTIRVVTLEQNRGKGGAVTHGMRHVRGKYVVFADADGASKFDDLGKLVSACQEVEDSQKGAVTVGSRAHLVDSEAVVKRSKLRNFLMHSFHLILRLLTPPATAAIKDTQCGFKLFSRASLPYIVPNMHCEGWIFDVEMLMLAEFAGIPVAEVPVGWREVTGSKLNVVWDSLGMAWGLAVLRAAWSFGIYKTTRSM